MKTRLLHTVLAALLMTGTAQALADTQDVAATLSVSGVITPTTAGCNVSLSRSVVYIQENISRFTATRP